MKLWLLISPAWDPWYDKAFGFVIRAETEADARAIADSKSGDENRGDNRPWLDSGQSTCVELTLNGPAGEIIRDYASA